MTDAIKQASINRFKNILVIIGVGLLIIAAVLLLTMQTGIIDMPEYLLPGESPIHSIARVAIIGCLLAAVGTRE